MSTGAYTVRVNTPNDDFQLTKEQVFEGLKIKAHDPIRFIPIIEQCVVIEKHPTGLIREVRFRGKSEPIREKVEFFLSGNITFTMTNPKTGDQLADITNLVSQTDDGELLLTFTFAFKPGSPLDEPQNAEEPDASSDKAAFDNVKHAVEVIRELVKEKKI